MDVSVPTHPRDASATSRQTNAKRRNYFNTISNSHKSHKKNIRKQSLYVSPRTGTLTDARDGDGDGAGNKSQQITTKTARTRIVHTSGHFQNM